MNKKKIIVAIVVVLLLIFAVFAGITVYKVSLLNNLVAKGVETREVRNYHMKVDQESDGRIDTEVWVKDNEHFLVKLGQNRVTMYRNGEERLTVYELYGQKSVKRNDASLIELYTFAHNMAPNPTLKEVLKTSIHSVQVDNKDCYEITLEDGTTVWVEKETALVVKAKTTEGTAKITQEIGTVTDADIQKPDVTGYPEM